VDLTALMHEKLDVPQKWGLAIQKHPFAFQGIKYKSRFNDRACLALFLRDKIEDCLPDTLHGTLSSVADAVEWLDKHKVSLF
jgi:hypothetical protein